MKAGGPEGPVLSEFEFDGWMSAVACFSDDRILLVRQGPQSPFGEGKFWLPMERVEGAEPRVEAAARAIQKESGYHIHPQDLRRLPTHTYYASMPLKETLRRVIRWETYSTVYQIPLLVPNQTEYLALDRLSADDFPNKNMWDVIKDLVEDHKKNGQT